MPGHTWTTVTRNLTDDPEFCHKPDGDVATIILASARCILDPAAGQRRDCDTLCRRCTLWRTPAKHAAVSLYQGRVIATGAAAAAQHSDNRPGEADRYRADADQVGASLRSTSATIVRPTVGAPKGAAAAPA